MAHIWHCCGCDVDWQLQLIGSLAWETPYAEGAAQEMAKRQKKKKKAWLSYQENMVKLSGCHFRNYIKTVSAIYYEIFSIDTLLCWLAGCDEESHYLEKPMWQGTEHGFWPVAIKELRPSA